jgi:hypothetical protein
MRRFPAVLWLFVYVGSLLILNGSHGKWDPWQLALGIALPVIACGLALYLAAGRWDGRPKVRGSYWFISGTFAFYAVCSLAALLFLGLAEAIVVLLAGIIPMTAVAVWLAGVRAKTRARRDGVLIDDTADDHEDPFPGLGVEDRRPMGDTADAHDDLIPQDLPKEHPGRKAAEEQAAAHGGATRGHREGGAVDAPRHTNDRRDAETVGADERDGARLKR